MSRKTVQRMVIAATLLAAIASIYFLRDHLNATALEQWVKGLGPWGPLGFMALYVTATLLFFPGSILTLLGGALFGPVFGTFYNLTGATLGATGAFLIARYLAADWATARSGGRLKRLLTGVEAEGWRFVAFVRLVPLFPFNALNYALGLTRIQVLPYILASFLFMLPGAVAYTYLGYAGRELAAGAEGTIQKSLLALALLAAIAFLPRFIARLRRGSTLTVIALKQALDQGQDIALLDVRSPKEFMGEDGHITNAINIPVDELPRRIEELEAWAEKPVAIVCHTDRRSATAARLLAQQGFAQVRVVEGGMKAWQATGFPVER